MSRAINVDLKQPDVLAACAEQGAAVSTSESLPSGGTRVVLVNSDGAALMRRIFESKLLLGAVQRTPFTTKGRS